MGSVSLRVICFVLEHRATGELTLMWIDSYPCPGFWVHPDFDDSPRALCFLPPTSFGGIRGKRGQGELVLRILDPTRSDSVLRDRDLQGGFIINTEARPAVVRFDAHVQLETASVLPFVLSTEDLSRMCRTGQHEVVESFRSERVEPHVWYCADFGTRSSGLAKGVVRFSKCSPAGAATVEGIALSSSRILPEDILTVSRFGRVIGRLTSNCAIPP